MQFEKRVLCTLGKPYPLGIIDLNGERCVLACTEDHGPLMLARPPYREATQVLAGPGGCMALVADSERPGELFAVMECFVGYKFQTAGVYHIRASAAGPSWSATKIIELPFAHRIELVEKGGRRYLIAANLTAGKSDPEDWSRPGALYASPVPRGPGESWELFPVLQNIHRNHGLVVTRFMGSRSVLVSGTEGVFAADLDSGGAQWAFRPVLRDEVSEMAVFDLDGDGRDELVTIEPFHGSALRVYRRDSGGWQKAWEAELDFGHCLLAGLVDGAPSILVSNRAGSRDLLLFRFDRGAWEGNRLTAPTRIVVDAGVGAANMLLLHHDGADSIFSTNQIAGEIAAYEVV